MSRRSRLDRATGGLLALAVLAAASPALAGSSFAYIGVEQPSPAAQYHIHHSGPSVASIGSTYYRGTGIFANAQGQPGYPAPPPRFLEREPGPRILDVSTERLDRQRPGPGEIAVSYVGTAKIIRLGPGYRGTREPEPRFEKDEVWIEPEPGESRQEFAARALQEPGLVVYPDPDEPEPVSPPAIMEEAPEIVNAPEPEPRPEPETISESFEPWTEEWLRDCVARYESFDASLGTFTDETGRRQFCF